MGKPYIFTLVFVLGMLLVSGSPSRLDQSFIDPMLRDTRDRIGVVEWVGNPFLAREDLPDGAAFVRNVWDLQVHQDRLYVGYGNSDNDSPGGNAGPIEVWYYDAAAQGFDFELTLEEEQISHFVVLGDVLMIPGHDPISNHELGTVYYKRGAAEWAQWNTVPNAAHVYDISFYGGLLVTALGSFDGSGTVIAWSQFGDEWTQAVISRSSSPDDNNASPRAYQLFYVGNQLLVSAIPYLRQADIPRDDPAYAFTTPIFRIVVDASNSRAPVVSGIEEVTIDLFPDAPDTVTFWNRRVARPVYFGGNTVYIGAYNATDHNWEPFSLYITTPEYEITSVALQEYEQAYDLLVVDDTLYALTARPQVGGYQMRVLATCDFAEWREVLRFSDETFSRSFEYYRGDFYFGQGTTASELAEQSGDILRISSSWFTPGCAQP